MRYCWLAFLRVSWPACFQDGCVPLQLHFSAFLRSAFAPDFRCMIDHLVILLRGNCCMLLPQPNVSDQIVKLDDLAHAGGVHASVRSGFRHSVRSKQPYGAFALVVIDANRWHTTRSTSRERCCNLHFSSLHAKYRVQRTPAHRLRSLGHMKPPGSIMDSLASRGAEAASQQKVCTKLQEATFAGMFCLLRCRQM